MALMKKIMSHKSNTAVKQHITNIFEADLFGF